MIDIVLLICLVIVMPGYQLWRSRTEATRLPQSRVAKYTGAILKAGGLIALLVADWLIEGRPFALLGLDWPLSRGGAIGLAITGAVLIGLAATARFQKPSNDPVTKEAVAVMQPETTAEIRLFVIFALIVGAAWELLYRGFLLWLLEPHIGTIGAVVVAATAYGCAHGYKNARLFSASLASAFVFTIAYALSRSLWWLMLLHAALPLLGGWLGRSRRQHHAGAGVPTTPS